MAKSKNSSQHNQSYKNHRNGIKGLRWNKYSSSKSVNQKLLRNTRRAKKFDPKIIKAKNLSKRIEFLRANKGKVAAPAPKAAAPAPKKVETKPAAPAKDAKAPAPKGK